MPFESSNYFYGFKVSSSPALNLCFGRRCSDREACCQPKGQGECTCLEYNESAMSKFHVNILKLLQEKKNVKLSVARLRRLRQGIKRIHEDATGCAHESTACFGVALQDQQQVTSSLSKGPVPRFLESVTQYLLLHHVKQEGILRKSGSERRAQTLMDLMEANGSQIPLGEFSAHDVTTVLKRWLRSLPEPIIPCVLHDVVTKCISLESSHHHRTQALLLTCLLLPAFHLNALKHIVLFLKEVSKNYNLNRMTSANIAKILAPCLMPRSFKNEAGAELAKDFIELSTSAIQCLIDNADLIGVLPPEYEVLKESKVLSQAFSEDDFTDTEEIPGAASEKFSQQNRKKLFTFLKSMGSSSACQRTSQASRTPQQSSKRAALSKVAPLSCPPKLAKAAGLGRHLNAVEVCGMILSRPGSTPPANRRSDNSRHLRLRQDDNSSEDLLRSSDDSSKTQEQLMSKGVSRKFLCSSSSIISARSSQSSLPRDESTNTDLGQSALIRVGRFSCQDLNMEATANNFSHDEREIADKRLEPHQAKSASYRSLAKDLTRSFARSGVRSTASFDGIPYALRKSQTVTDASYRKHVTPIKRAFTVRCTSKPSNILIKAGTAESTCWLSSRVSEKGLTHMLPSTSRSLYLPNKAYQEHINEVDIKTTEHKGESSFRSVTPVVDKLRRSARLMHSTKCQRVPKDGDFCDITTNSHIMPGFIKFETENGVPNLMTSDGNETILRSGKSISKNQTSGAFAVVEEEVTQTSDHMSIDISSPIKSSSQLGGSIGQANAVTPAEEAVALEACKNQKINQNSLCTTPLDKNIFVDAETFMNELKKTENWQREESLLIRPSAIRTRSAYLGTPANLISAGLEETSPNSRRESVVAIRTLRAGFVRRNVREIENNVSTPIRAPPRANRVENTSHVADPHKRVVQTSSGDTESSFIRPVNGWRFVRRPLTPANVSKKLSIHAVDSGSGQFSDLMQI